MEQRKFDTSANSTVFVPFSSLVSSVISGEKNDNATQEVSVAAARKVIVETLHISDEKGRRFSEIGLIMGLILGRWFTPDALKGKELSALLLSYVGNAADILEVLESLGTEGVTYSQHATIGILGIYTWSLLQFALVTTWETERTEQWSVYRSLSQDRSSILRQVSYKFFKPSPGDGGEDSCTVSPQSTLSRRKKKKSTYCWGYYHEEYPQMLVQIVMQDGPFLLLRLALCVKYKIINELHVFFLCKNALICLILVFRFATLLNEKKKEKDMKSARDDLESIARYSGNSSLFRGREHERSSVEENGGEKTTTKRDDDAMLLIVEGNSAHEEEPPKEATKKEMSKDAEESDARSEEKESSLKPVNSNEDEISPKDE